MHDEQLVKHEPGLSVFGVWVASVRRVARASRSGARSASERDTGRSQSHEMPVKLVLNAFRLVRTDSISSSVV